MITIKRTTSDDLDFKYLTQLFDDYLVDIDGDENSQYCTPFCKHIEHE